MPLKGSMVIVTLGPGTGLGPDVPGSARECEHAGRTIITTTVTPTRRTPPLSVNRWSDEQGDRSGRVGTWRPSDGTRMGHASVPRFTWLKVARGLASSECPDDCA